MSLAMRVRLCVETSSDSREFSPTRCRRASRNVFKSPADKTQTKSLSFTRQVNKIINGGVGHDSAL